MSDEKCTCPKDEIPWHNNPDCPVLKAESSFAAPTLLAAVELACDKWSWIQAGTREPLSISLKRTEREMDVFEMIVSMNNLRTQFEKWKAANNQVSDGGGS